MPPFKEKFKKCSAQPLSSPRRHARQVPQADEPIVTRSPTATFVTKSPMAAISPAFSWPPKKGYSAFA